MPISVNTKIQDPGVGAVVQAALGSGAQEGDNLAMEEALLILMKLRLILISITKKQIELY